jgi:glucokinase
MREYVIGLDLGGSSVKWLSADRAGASLAQGNVAFDPDRPMHWAEEIRAVVQNVKSSRRDISLRGIGLSAPGLAARDERSIAFMPGRLAGLENLVWQEFLGTKFPIPVLNDAHSALLGEAWIGAASGRKNVVMLTLGTGVGGAAIVDGRLLLGNIGRAGHLGHVCLDPNGRKDVTNMAGSLEALVGNCTIEERTHGRFKTTHDLIAAQNSGDAGASAIWLKSVRDLGCAIASFINVLDPELVVVGGGIAGAGAALFGPLEDFVRDNEWQPGGHKVPIVPAQLGEFAGAFGSAKRAWEVDA